MFQLDTGQNGLHMFFKGWQIKILEYMWSVQPSGANNKEVLIGLQKTMPETISRTSVIHFLKDMAEKGVLTEERKTGRGGYYGTYYHKYSESELKQHLSEHVIRKLLKDYPEETRKAIETTLLKDA